MKQEIILLLILCIVLFISGCEETKEQLPPPSRVITIVECGECEYQEGDTCIPYECCEDDDCRYNEYCENHECLRILCGYCQYVENKECKPYTCCEDEDCDDNDVSTKDICLYPKTKRSACSNPSVDECTTNLDCDDKKDSTNDICAEIPRKCFNVEITNCISGDNYCPSGCTHKNDRDCEIKETDCGSSTITFEVQENVDNFDCFIEASEICEIAKLEYTTGAEVFGMVSTSTTSMEIKGMDSGKCIYYQKTNSASVEFSDAFVQQMLDSGLSQEEVNQQEQIANEAVQETVGLERTCKFDTYDLTFMLNNWKEGTFSSGTTSCTLNPDGTSDCTTEGGDFGVAECEEIKK